ncbi:MAG: NUDIX hydrolase [Pelagimonas sp.]
MSHPILAALAVVVHEEHVLLVRRRNPPDAGLWGYPGGKVDYGEAVLSAAERELLEETGVSAQASVVLDGLDVIGLDDNGQVVHHYFLAAVLCAYKSGDPVANDDADEARWVPIAEVLGGALSMSKDVDRVLRLALAVAKE